MDLGMCKDSSALGSLSPAPDVASAFTPVLFSSEPSCNKGPRGFISQYGFIWEALLSLLDMDLFCDSIPLSLMKNMKVRTESMGLGKSSMEYWEKKGVFNFIVSLLIEILKLLVLVIFYKGFKSFWAFPQGKRVGFLETAADQNHTPGAQLSVSWKRVWMPQCQKGCCVAAIERGEGLPLTFHNVSVTFL